MQEQARAPAALFLPFPEPGQRPQLSTADTHTHTTHAHTRPTQRQHMGYMHTGRSNAKHKETTRIHAALLQRTARQPLPHRGRSQPSPWSPELRTEPHPSQPVCTLRSHGMGQHRTHTDTQTHTHTRPPRAAHSVSCPAGPAHVSSWKRSPTPLFWRSLSFHMLCSSSRW